MFSLYYTVKMFDTDASGFLFFTSQMRMAHEAYEAFMTSKGLSISSILRSSEFLLPIVHAETDYAGPSHVGDDIRIEIATERVGRTSFTLAYRFVQADGLEVGKGRTVHVAMGKESREAIPLPKSVRAAVEQLPPR